MKKCFYVMLALFSTLIMNAQQIDYYLDDGLVAEGYDVTEYFNGKAIEGNKKYVTTYDGVKFRFSSASNLEKFKSNPKKYTPQYGGYCAYALATANKKADSDPETFEVRNGKLFLFYNSWGINNLNKWLANDPSKLNLKADANWEKLKYKK